MLPCRRDGLSSMAGNVQRKIQENEMVNQELLKHFIGLHPASKSEQKHVTTKSKGKSNKITIAARHETRDAGGYCPGELCAGDDWSAYSAPSLAPTLPTSIHIPTAAKKSTNKSEAEGERHPNKNSNSKGSNQRRTLQNKQPPVVSMKQQSKPCISDSTVSCIGRRPSKNSNSKGSNQRRTLQNKQAPVVNTTQQATHAFPTRYPV